MSEATISKFELEKLLKTAEAFEDLQKKQLSEAAEAEQRKRIEAEVEKALEKVGFGKPAAPAFVMPGAEAKDGQKVLTTDAFFKGVIEQQPLIGGVVSKVSPQSTTSAQGGYAIPTGWNTMIEGAVNNASQFMKLFKTIRVSTRKFEMPVWASGLTTYWSTELTDKYASDATLGNLEHTLQFNYSLVEMSRELEIFNNVNFGDELLKLYAEAFALEIEKQALIGSGAPFTGATSTTNEVIAGGNLDYDDLVTAMNNATMLERYRANAVWAANRADIAKIMGLKDSTSRPIWQIGLENGAVNMALLGRPVLASDQVAAGTILFLDPSVISVARYSGVDTFVEYFRAGTGPTLNLIRANASALRFETLVSVGVLTTKGIVKITGVA